MTAARRERAIELYRAGMSEADIAVELMCGWRTVQAWLADERPARTLLREEREALIAARWNDLEPHDALRRALLDGLVTKGLLAKTGHLYQSTPEGRAAVADVAP